MAALLAERGAAVIDSDALNRAQLGMPEVVDTLTSWWGTSICGPDGALDRERIAEKIFADESERRKLERFLHPRIAAHRERLIEAYQRDPAVGAIVLDSPLLQESGLWRRCDAVLFVDADDAVRRERVVQHRGWTEAEWRRRENSQFALDKKRSNADYVVVNNSWDLDELRLAVHELVARLGMPGSLKSS